jgi:hypothetical protein
VLWEQDNRELLVPGGPGVLGSTIFSSILSIFFSVQNNNNSFYISGSSYISLYLDFFISKHNFFNNALPSRSLILGILD